MLLTVWAPAAGAVEVVVEGGPRIPMQPARPGWWQSADAALTHGTRYRVSLDGAPPVVDGRAVHLPDGVFGPAALYDHSRFEWHDAGWRPPPWPRAVVYELHVGTFTAHGTLDAAIAHLDHLVDLGVTHVELMPLAGFDGTHGWGYDGVFPWSVHEPYGGPDALKRFVDAAHARGLAVLLDLVLNHLGPRGATLHEQGPLLTDRRETPWGKAINLDLPAGRSVRDLLTDCVQSWLRDFHLDGLRLDATHELVESRPTYPPFLAELAQTVAGLGAALGRQLVLVAEDDRNEPHLTRSRDHGGWGLTAQWADDVHHALHVALTGEAQGYYGDFAAEPDEALRRTLTEAFFHTGQWSSFRGRHWGRPVDREETPGYRFVAALQTHDQVGNRATGDRIAALADPGGLRCGIALVLTAPFVPMLFMGEEWGSRRPWQFFTSYTDPGLGAAVTAGRRAEFADHGWSATGAAPDVPDPQDPATRDRSVLDWSEREQPAHREIEAWYRRLLELRRTVPDLHDSRLDQVDVDVDDGLVVVHRGQHRVVANLSRRARAVDLDTPATLLAASDENVVVAGTSVRTGPRSAAIVRLADRDRPDEG
jgi:maltooligosyltrehalose trehalohydrolase